MEAEIIGDSMIHPSGKIQTYVYDKYEWVPYCFHVDDIRSIKKHCLDRDDDGTPCRTAVSTYYDFDVMIIQASFEDFEKWWLAYDPTFIPEEYYDVEFESDLILDDEYEDDYEEEEEY